MEITQIEHGFPHVLHTFLLTTLFSLAWGPMECRVLSGALLLPQSCPHLHPQGTSGLCATRLTAPMKRDGLKLTGRSGPRPVWTPQGTRGSARSRVDSDGKGQIRERSWWELQSAIWFSVITSPFILTWLFCYPITSSEICLTTNCRQCERHFLNMSGQRKDNWKLGRRHQDQQQSCPSRDASDNHSVFPPVLWGCNYPICGVALRCTTWGFDTCIWANTIPQ